MESFEVYKKWRKSANSAGFASFYLWPDADKVKIEIADVDPNTNKIKSLSTCYVDVYEFYAYLHAEVHGNQAYLAPLKERGQKHGITVFGGNAKVSRVFKIEDWAFDARNSDAEVMFSNTRRFKCGEFEVKPSKQAIQPDYTKPIAVNSIQMKPSELAALYARVSVNLTAAQTVKLMNPPEPDPDAPRE